MGMLLMHGGKLIQSKDAPYQVSQGIRPSKLTDSAGNIKQMNHADSIGANFMAATNNQVAADGDRFYMYMYADGTETKLMLSTLQYSSHPIFDIYINGTLDSAGYDDYAAAAVILNRYITLTQKLRIGFNEIQFRVNGKNVASSDYYMTFFGVSCY